MGTAPPVPPEPPWTANDVRLFTDQFIDARESARIADVKAAAVALALSEPGVKQFTERARYNPTAKAAVKTSTPEVAADLLNVLQRHTGIGPKYRHHLNCAYGWLVIIQEGRQLRADLEAILEKDRAAKAAKQPI